MAVEPFDEVDLDEAEDDDEDEDRPVGADPWYDEESPGFSWDE
jgi:hypothetical protein